MHNYEVSDVVENNSSTKSLNYSAVSLLYVQPLQTY